MKTDIPLWLVLAASPEVSGADALWNRVRAHAESGGAVRAIVTGDGLDWLADARLAALARCATVEVSLCSKSARDQGRRAKALPTWLRWSSLVVWLRDAAADDALWGLLP